MRKRLSVALVGLLLMPGMAIADGPDTARWFPDRPVAWNEYDDADTPSPPDTNHLQELDTTLTIRDSMANEADRILAFEGRVAARDVNALDEVPCSTWYCPRNHLRPMSVTETAAGPPAEAPQLPFTVIKGKDLGAATGFQVKDAAGRRFLLKFDIAGHLGMANAGEIVGSRIFHAAGYNVPGAITVDFGEDDLKVDPSATYLLYRVQKRPLTEAHVRETLAKTARLPDGRLRAVAISWVQGTILGSFDMLNVRRGDPNDLIPHQHRRSLRASRLLFAWLSVLDPSPINTIDSYVEVEGRRFVRHYFSDFGCAFGSATNYMQGPQQDGEYLVEVGRTLASIFSLGIYQRPFHTQRGEWHRLTALHPALGYFPAETFDPDTFRTNRKLPPHMRMTDRDAYWGAKVVTSFSDEQVAAVVASARIAEVDAQYLNHALLVRRDTIGRRYLRAVAAVENPTVTPDGSQVCFDDLAVVRGAAKATEVRYRVAVSDGRGTRLAAFEQAASGPNACVPIAAGVPGSGYRVVTLETQLSGGAGRGLEIGKAAHLHLRWREKTSRFVVVGLERDE